MSINITHGGNGPLDGIGVGLAALGPGMQEAKQNELLDAHIKSAEADATLNQLNAERAKRVADLAKQRRLAQQSTQQAQGAMAQEVAAGTTWDELGQIASSAGLAPVLGPLSSIGLEEGKDYPSVLTPVALSTAADLSENPQAYREYVGDLVARQAQVVQQAENAVVGELAQELGAKGVISPEEVNKYVQSLAGGDATAADVYQALAVRQKYAKGVLMKQRTDLNALATIDGIATPEWANSASREDRAFVDNIRAELESGGALLTDPSDMVDQVKMKVLGLTEYHEQEMAKARSEGIDAAMASIAEEFQQFDQHFKSVNESADRMGGGPAPIRTGSLDEAGHLTETTGQAMNLSGATSDAVPHQASAQSVSDTQPSQAGPSMAEQGNAAMAPIREEMAKQSAGLKSIKDITPAMKPGIKKRIETERDRLRVSAQAGDITRDQAVAQLEAFVRKKLKLDLTPDEVKALLQ